MSKRKIALMTLQRTGDLRSYSEHFAIDAGSCHVRLVRRPVVMQPPDSTVTLVDDGNFSRIGSRVGEALFIRGKWIGVAFAPTFWSVLDR